ATDKPLFSSSPLPLAPRPPAPASSPPVLLAPKQAAAAAEAKRPSPRELLLQEKVRVEVFRVAFVGVV
ncbi:unnamed protein product, partial [Urochloa humidicola]